MTFDFNSTKFDGIRNQTDLINFIFAKNKEVGFYDSWFDEEYQYHSISL